MSVDEVDPVRALEVRWGATTTARQRFTVSELQNRRLRDHRLGYPAVPAAVARYDDLDRMIGHDVRRGAVRHTRLPWAVRQVPRLVALIDLAVLFTFCGIVFNVDPGAPLTTPVATLAALFLAVLASGVAYSWLAVTGARLKIFRSEIGEVVWGVVGRTTWLLIGVSLVLVAALGVLMYSRVVAEAVSAEQQAGPAVLLGVVFAVVSVVGNLSVIAVHALDGSVPADEHRHVGRVLERHERRLRRARRALLRAGGQGFSA